MSTKEKHLLQMVLDVLVEATYERDREVTAGELAKYLGVARSTAKRYLDRLVVMNEVCVYETSGKNHMTKRVYERVGFTAHWRRNERNLYPGDRAG